MSAHELQTQLGQELTQCGNPGDVLRLLEDFQIQNKAKPSTGNMATAMHRIASTGSQEAADREWVISNLRFQQLVFDVEHALEKAPQTFGEQHLANVVWGAAKLRLRKEALFYLVHHEVLSSRRQLEKFSPQQLAAIAWSYAMVNYDVPQLFEAVQEEAMRKPQLAEMLSKAGLLRGGGGGGGTVGVLAGQGRVGLPGGAGVARPNMGQGNNHAMGAGGGVVGNGNQGMYNHSGGGHGQALAHQGGPQGYGGQALQHGRGGPGGMSQASHASHMQAGMLGGYMHGSAGHAQSSHASSKGMEVARAAEEHKKEMEEKQRLVIGCEEGGELCPLCVEEMDATDMALLPCPCGYQVCLLCLNKIRNEGNKQCPACRSEYEEDKFRKVDPPPKKKKGEEGGGAADTGWECSTSKKKTSSKKTQAPLTFPGFPPRVADMLAQCHEACIVSKGELDERVMEDLKALPERGAIAVLSEFMKKDMTRIRNKSAFVNGIIDRVQKELAHDKTGAGLGAGGGNLMGWQGNQNMGYNVPVGGGGVSEQQRLRSLSDVDNSNLRAGYPPTSGGMGGSVGMQPQQHQQQQQKVIAGGRPQQPVGVIGGGMQRGVGGARGAGGMGSLSWSGANDEEVDHLQNGFRGFGISGNAGGDAIGSSGGLLGGLSHEDPAEVARARQKVERFLMEHAATAATAATAAAFNMPQQPQQQQQQQHQYGHAIPGGFSALGSGGGGMGNLGALGAGDLGALSQGGGGIRMPGPAGLRAPGIIGPLHGRQSEEQARANKEAGSRLLEYINRGGVANGALPEPRQDSQAKQPLFMRVNGDADGWNTDLEPRPLVAKASWEEEEDAILDRCSQCGRDGRGDFDQTDGHFYCNDCWGAFEVMNPPKWGAWQEDASSRSGSAGAPRMCLQDRV